MPHCAVVSAWCSPIDRCGARLAGARGRRARGPSGGSSASAASFWPAVFARERSSSARRSRSLTAIGASDVESTPPAIAGLELAEADLVAQRDDGLEAGRARLLHVVRGGLGGERRAEHGLAGEVEVAGVLEHRARGDLADPLALQPVPGDEPVERGGEHVLVAGVRVRAAGAGEGDPVAAEHEAAAVRSGPWRVVAACHEGAFLSHRRRAARADGLPSGVPLTSDVVSETHST